MHFRFVGTLRTTRALGCCNTRPITVTSPTNVLRPHVDLHVQLLQRAGLHSLVASRAGSAAGAASAARSFASPLGPLLAPTAGASAAAAGASPGSSSGLLLGGWSACAGPVRWCQAGQLSKQRVFKREGINDVIMPNTTQLRYGTYGIRAMASKRVGAATIEAVRR